MNWPELLSSLVRREDQTAAATAWAMEQILSGNATPAQMAAFVIGLRSKGETVAELTGLADIMIEFATPIEIGGPAVDVVGSGGDRSNTVNISTMAAVVAAAAGAKVVKHGNRAASSACGAADVLEALGVVLDLTPEAQQQVDPLELVDPILERRGGFSRWRGRARERAGGAKLASGDGAEAREGLVAQNRDEVEVLVGEDHGRDAQPAADADLLGHVNNVTYVDYLQGGTDTPFWLRNSLGGRRSLRGYGSDRFVDFNRALLSAELRTRVYERKLFGVNGELELAPFVEAGQVFRHIYDPPLDDLHIIGGMGIRALVRPQLVAFVDIGYGSEGDAIFTGIDYPF